MKLIKGLTFPFIIGFIWYILSFLNCVNPYLVPSPGKVFSTMLELTQHGALVKHIETSLLRVFAGFGMTCLFAIPLAVLLGMNRKLEVYFNPLLHFIRHIPPIACIPLLILWFGIGEASKLAIIVLAAFFPLFLNTLEGITTCDSKLLEVGSVFGFSNQEKFLRIILPAALPAIILGMRLGLGYSWRALIGAELIAASTGIGYMIIEAEQISRPDIVLVGIISIGILGYLIDVAFLLISHTLLPWHRKQVEDVEFSAKGSL